jgi:hypothetical protein
MECIHNLGEHISHFSVYDHVFTNQGRDRLPASELDSACQTQGTMRNSTYRSALCSTDPFTSPIYFTTGLYGTGIFFCWSKFQSKFANHRWFLMSAAPECQLHTQSPHSAYRSSSSRTSSIDLQPISASPTISRS